MAQKSSVGMVFYVQLLLLHCRYVWWCRRKFVAKYASGISHLYTLLPIFPCKHFAIWMSGYHTRTKTIQSDTKCFTTHNIFFTLLFGSLRFVTVYTVYQWTVSMQLNTIHVTDDARWTNVKQCGVGRFWSYSKVAFTLLTSLWHPSAISIHQNT